MWNLRTLAQVEQYKTSSGLFKGSMDGNVRLTTLAVEHSVVVMTSDFHSKQYQIES